MINVLAYANDSKQFMKKIPEVLKIVKKYRQRLLSEKVPVWDLIVTKHLSKHPSKYKQRVSQVIAAEQLTKEGAEIHAGKNIRFLFTNTEDKRYECRVKAEQLVEKGVNADNRKYLLLLYSAASSLLGFLGYTPKSIYDAVRGHTLKHLDDF
jgi:DNA polymerase elongation subunit (family B)